MDDPAPEPSTRSVAGTDPARSVAGTEPARSVAGTEPARSVAGTEPARSVAGRDTARSDAGETAEPGLSPSEYRGFFDRYEDGHASGWIMWVDAPGRAMTLDVLVDGAPVDTIVADERREDVRAILQLSDARVGFGWTVENRFLDGAPHRLSFRMPNGRIVPFIGEGGITDLRDGCDFSGLPSVIVQGHVDGFARGTIRGWVLRRLGRRDPGSGSCHLTVSCDGVPVGQIKADRFRPDVASALGCVANCGFEFAIPPRLRKPYAQTYRFVVVPDGIELDNSPFSTTGIDDHLEGKLIGVMDRVNRVHRELLRELTELRREVTGLLPASGWTIEDYDRWARRYYDGLRARVAMRREAAARAENGAEPLVSVLLPTYRPLPADFTAAVESVIAQTWRHWELIIVDDGGKSDVVTALIDEFARRDPRIRPIKRKRNVGIARATNVAIEAARGDWIAFFDHDDVLVDVALEVMVREAEASGARMLYSDEDKIDPAGYFLEPNFKPDWNHRYLLGCNYVCHLLVVAADTVRAVGPLRSEYDGAQDHDFILRVAELIGDDAIRHVPELLYHWRKTPGSTAADISNKQYAVTAGVRAVSDHLARTGRAATVRAIDALTIYEVAFDLGRQPTVAAVIPYKDELAMTRRCVDVLREADHGASLSVVLVDNWSVSPDAAAFRDEMAAVDEVRVLLVEEEFNYARLNNLAVAATDAEFILFMNNDVFMSEGDFLRRMLGEMVDPTVGAVGAKLLYPNGAVQHAGVLAGVHGVAAHMHAGIGGAEYGYIGRARLSQELTAVTGACMLVRRTAFAAVGGFDEERLAVAYNDVDLCLKLRDAGWRVILNAEAIGEHHESLSRGSDLRPEQEDRFFTEQQAMFERWREHALFRHDPAYSRWFSREDRPFFDLVDPRGADAP